MTRERVILVTGVSGLWGRAAAQTLLQLPGLRILGIDRQPPQRQMPGLDFIKADLRNPLLVELMRAEGVDSVLHLAWTDNQWRRESTFESNVLGTMHLVGACAEAGVTHITLRSATAIYGAQADNPMYITEEQPIAARSRYGAVRDAVDVEQFLVEFSAEYPELAMAVLRLANVVGPEVDSPLTRLLKLPFIPSLMGFDPLLQVIDFDDAVAALVQATLDKATDAFNIAADGVLGLHQLAGLAGKLPLPVPHLLAYWGWSALAATPQGRNTLRFWPLEPDYLRYPWTASTARMKSILGYEPRGNARQTVEHFVQAARIRPFTSGSDQDAFGEDELDERLAQAAWDDLSSKVGTP